MDFTIKKITQYLFAEHGKLGLMKSMGYSIADADDIYIIMSQNAKEKYLNGQYTLKKLNIYGQRINIDLTLQGKSNKGEKNYTFYTGWTVYPNGKTT